MSFENTLSRIATALETIATNTTPGVTSTPTPAVAQAPVPTPAPTPAPVVAQPPAAPFTTPAEMQEYVKQTYQAIGPEKGNQMIEILKGMGVNTIKDLQPENYGAFYLKVEALKGV